MAKCWIVLDLVEGQGEASWNEGGRCVVQWWRGGSDESWSYVAAGKTMTGLPKPLPGALGSVLHDNCQASVSAHPVMLELLWDLSKMTILFYLLGQYG